MFYICSLSTKVIIYKGMLTPAQVLPYFPDLRDEDFETHLAMVHSRFSTNTFPSWDRAQPLRFMSHNGEINTLRGNKNWMRAREGSARSELFGEQLQKLFPVVEPHCSDSGTFDNVLEFLLMNGPYAAGSDHDDGSRGVAEARDDAGREASVLRVLFLFDGALGWSGFDCVYRRASTSARRSTETDCDRVATTSRTTTA